jgi:hypothetical protein
MNNNDGNTGGGQKFPSNQYSEGEPKQYQNKQNSYYNNNSYSGGNYYNPGSNYNSGNFSNYSNPQNYNNYNYTNSNYNNYNNTNTQNSYGSNSNNRYQTNNKEFSRQGFSGPQTYSNNNKNNTYIDSFSNLSLSKEKKTWITRYEKTYISNKVKEEDEVFLKDHLKLLLLNQNQGINKLFETKIYLYENNQLKDQKNLKDKFSELGLNSVLLENVNKLKFETLTPIQKTVIPLMNEKQDIMGCAQTGSGKTVAFLLPIINKMLESGPPSYSLNPKTSYPLLLVLLPTRELADQIFRVARLLTSGTGIHVVVIYGGISHEEQIKELKYGADIIIATPGRLIDFLKSKQVNLTLLENLIIDEADRILEMGFEKQISEIVNMHGMPDKKNRQNLLFSATFSKDIMSTVKDALNSNYLLATSNIDEYEVNENIIQSFYYVEEKDKPYKLHELLQTCKGTAIGTFFYKHFF